MGNLLDGLGKRPFILTLTEAFHQLLIFHTLYDPRTRNFSIDSSFQTFIDTL